MQPFTLTLSNGGVLSGLQYMPKNSATRPKHCPLVVGIHGASYKSSYFDSTPACSATLTSQSYGVPFVAIDRPGYGESTSVEPLPEGSSFAEEWGLWLHRYILPAVWREFGQPHDCTCMVLHCHSLATNGALVGAALHAREPGAYPLGGLVVSGFGSALTEPHADAPANDADAGSGYIDLAAAVKNTELLRPGSAPTASYAQTERLSQPMPVQELACMRGSWTRTWRRKWADGVRAPLMIGLAEHDNFWPGTEEHLRDYVASFPHSVRVDGSLIRGAPHNLEQSYWAQGWFARSFGFAMECAAAVGVEAAAEAAVAAGGE